MHARANKYVADGEDPREMRVAGVKQMEYDGLHGGELAWVLGRRFKGVDNAGPGALNASGGVDLDVGNPGRYAHMAHSGLGSGVDRMQRLASTGWMESMTGMHLGGMEIALHRIVLGSDYQRKTDGLMGMFGKYVRGGNAVYCPDPVAALVESAGPGGQGLLEQKQVEAMSGKERISGVNVFEEGPFLRGIQVNTDDVSLRIPELKDFNEKYKTGSMPRNLGDMCVFSAIESELRRRNFMDWSPDGIVLSKLESPTDQPLSSAELDAQQAQLFNVAVQGPAITTAWTSDVRDHKLECQPMDKVFICLVADLCWREVPSATVLASTTNLMNAMREVAKKLLDKTSTAREIDNLLGACKDAGEDLRDQMSGVQDPEYIKRYRDWREKHLAFLAAPNDSAKKLAYEAAKRSALELMDISGEKPGTGRQYQYAQNQFRSGQRRVGKAYLTNFRLMRSTSSHMTNYSKFVKGKKTSRCGLPFGYPTIDAGTAQGAASYIVGAWCIGTVLDSAASRSSVGTLVRTAPASMALNINVNICWWSSDKLYKHYMDRSLLQRGQVAQPDETDTKKRKFEEADKDKPKGGGTGSVDFAGSLEGEIGIDDVDVPGEGGGSFYEAAREAASQSATRFKRR
tara:strand:+ start:196 stop:2076 length:1881 start_codon:yes stop_codon:yes gene_type:complete